jgi:PncC family amidohydrolase
VYGADDESLEAVVISRLRLRGLRVATAEAATGGLLAAQLSAVTGSAEPFPGGLIAGAVEAGPALLGVPESLVREHGLASAPVAEALAQGAQRALSTEFGLSVTGLPGPGGGTADKPAGLIFIGLAGPDGVSSRRYEFPGSPDDVRHRAVMVALDWLRRTLLDGGA